MVSAPASRRIAILIANITDILISDTMLLENSIYLPFVFGPEFAIARIPAPTNRNSGWISSALMGDGLSNVG